MRYALLIALVASSFASTVDAQAIVRAQTNARAGARTAAQTAQAAALPAIDTLALRAHTRFLADDALAGRGTGTRGERIAAAYIASELQRMGLQGVGPDGDYLVPVPLRAARVDTATHIVLSAPGTDAQTYRHGADFILNTGGEGAFRDFAGPVVFAGPPAQAAETLRDMELRGRVIAVAGPLGGQALELVPSWIAAGVTGVLVLVPDAAQFDLYRRSRGDARYYVAADVQDPVWQPALPVVIAGARLTTALLRPALTTGQPMPDSTGRAIVLDASIAANIVVHEQALPAANIAAVLPGSDATLRNEYVVYTAHYDHLGISIADAEGDSIYNGFSDNAAGVAMLLAIADAVRDAPPARSLLFLFFTGEERGLLGASYLAANPPVPIERMHALINLDAGAPSAPPASWRVAGGDSTALGALAEQVAADHGWVVQLSGASPNSDYWPFLQRGVPSVFLIPGDVWEDTSPEQRDALREQWDHYHQPADEYHPDFPFSGLLRYADYALALGMRSANQQRGS